MLAVVHAGPGNRLDPAADRLAWPPAIVASGRDRRAGGRA